MAWLGFVILQMAAYAVFTRWPIQAWQVLVYATVVFLYGLGAFKGLKR